MNARQALRIASATDRLQKATTLFIGVPFLSNHELYQETVFAEMEKQLEETRAAFEEIKKQRIGTAA